LELSDLSEKLEFLDKFFSLSGKVSYMVDLGNIGSTVTKLWSQLTSHKKGSGTAKSLIKTIAAEGGELTVQYSGAIAMKLKDLTKSFLPDIEIDLGSFNFLVTLNGGSTGLPMGIYMYFESNIAKGLLSALSEVSEHLGGILDKIGFKMPNVSALDINAGVFFNTKAMGFKFLFLGLDVQCMFMFSTDKGSCKFGDKIFTAIINAGKWVIKEAKKLFDEAGDEIIEADIKIADFSRKTFADVKSGVKVLGKDVAKVATTGAKDVAKVATTGAKDLAKVATTGAKDLANVGKKTVSDIKSIAKKLHL